MTEIELVAWAASCDGVELPAHPFDRVRAIETLRELIDHCLARQCDEAHSIGYDEGYDEGYDAGFSDGESASE